MERRFRAQEDLVHGASSDLATSTWAADGPEKAGIFLLPRKELGVWDEERGYREEFRGKQI